MLSTYESKRMIDTSKVNRVLQKKRNKRRFFNVFIFISILVLIYLIVLSLTNTKLLSVSTFSIDISDQRKLDEKVLSNNFDMFLEETFLGIPKSAYYLFVPKSFENIVKEDNILIKDIDISWDFFNIWEIEVKERIPAAVYCKDVCHLVDDVGVLFDETIDVYEVSLEDNGTENVLWERYADSEVFFFVKRIVEFLGSENLLVDSVYVDKEVGDVVLLLENGVKFIFDTDDEIYALTRSIHLAVFNVYKGNLSTLNYIDFRNPSEIYHSNK